MRTSHVIIALLVWAAVAAGLGAAGAVAHLRPPGPQMLIAALTAALLVVGAAVGPIHRWAATVDLRAVVALHLTRFVGAYFLVLHARGELPYAFAVPGGIGDIVVATLALVLIRTVRPTAPAGRWAYLAWNALGLFDILGVVATAAAQGTADPPSMDALLRLPLSLLPTFLVPLVIASHVLMFARLTRSPHRAPTEPAPDAGARVAA